MSGFRIREEGLGRVVEFEFDGRRYQGFESDTLASALMANGVSVVGRSFKFHRPRGILSAGVEEPNALVTLHTKDGRIPNARATLTPLSEGLKVTSQNAWPSVAFDLLSLLGAAPALMPAGFYYKTFKFPRWSWYEPIIRRLAGLGPAPDGAAFDQADSANLNCEILVIGAGPAGRAAASRAAQASKDVVLMGPGRVSPVKNVRVLSGATGFDLSDPATLMAVQAKANGAEKFWRIHARRIIIATGAMERAMAFPNNDRPGVMLAGAAGRYLSRHGVAPGRKVVIATNNNSAYGPALELAKAGVEIAAIVDARADAGPLPAELSHAPLYKDAVILNAKGRPHVNAVAVGARNAIPREEIDCDALLVSGGWSPSVHLFSQAGGALRYDEEIAAFRPASPEHGSLFVAGAARGVFGDAQADGEAAADKALGSLGYTVAPVSPEREKPETYAIAPVWRTTAAHEKRQWIDFQHDVTAADIRVAAQEGFHSVEHLKRYTTLGMSVDQGKTGNLLGLALLGEHLGRPPGEVGVTTFRPPFHPVRFSTIAAGAQGDRYHALRVLPACDFHDREGAVFGDDGGWMRPQYYQSQGLSVEECIEREVRAVRDSAGVFDASSLGKFEIAGPDAPAFLQRILYNSVENLKIGAARYVFMLNERGVIINDGIAARLGAGRFLVYTTSSGAAGIGRWLEQARQRWFSDMKVMIADVTESYGVVTVTGPRARDVLAALETDMDFSRDAFAHMTIKAGDIEGCACRVLRASYTGEASFELNVPADAAAFFFEKLEGRARDIGARLFGVEAIDILRLEKGFIELGGDTTPETTPLDLGFSGPLRKKKADFIGRRTLSMASSQRDGRLHLVGLKSADQNPLPVGAHVVKRKDMPHSSDGYVTSSAFSPTLNRPVALGLVRAGQARRGETIRLYSEGAYFEAEITDPTSYDPEAERLHG